MHDRKGSSQDHAKLGEMGDFQAIKRDPVRLKCATLPRETMNLLQEMKPS